MAREPEETAFDKDRRLIFHVDVNSAFLSWEAVDRLSRGESLDLRTVPSCVGGNPENRTSIVSAKSIPAKAYGISTGEPVSMALRKCPDLIVVEPHFTLYRKMSRAFKAILQEYTPAMESFSIDEVFLDMSGMGRLWPDPVELAFVMKDRIRRELGFTVNVGIARNKLLAKMASDFEKPDRVHTLYPEEIEAKLWPLPVGRLFGCGKATALRLETMGLRTIGDLARAEVGRLERSFGKKTAAHLHDSANGLDDSPVDPVSREAKSYSVETTTREDLTDFPSIERLLRAQADVVGYRLRKDGVRARCITFTFRNRDFQRRSHGRTLENATDVTEVIYREGVQLAREAWKGEPLRLIGLGASEIDRDGFEQLSFFEDPSNEKQKKLDRALDAIRGKYGMGSIQRAGIGSFREKDEKR